MAVITMNSLCKRYGDRPALKELNLEIDAGALFGFIGPNGAGKTTAIRLLLGMLKPTSGTVEVFGSPVHANVRTNMGYLPGDLKLQGWLSGVEACKILSMVHGRDLSKTFFELIDLFELDPGVSVRNMSRGMRQKLGLVMAMSHQPSLLVLDEPTTALDPLTQDRLTQHLRRLSGQGHTVFFSSHILSEVADLCDRVAIVRKGELVEHEALAVLRSRARRMVTLRWPKGETPDPPEFLDFVDKQDHFWRAFLNTDVPNLLNWLAHKQVADMTLGEPDLDSLFRTFYLEDEAC